MKIAMKAKTMTNSNWPDPKRPGVPLFPEKTLRHALKKKDSGEIIIRNWKSDGQHWDMIGYSAQWCSETYFYEGPVFTHTQISEMLAAERESDLHCALMDSAYVSGMKVGWNCAQNDDSARYNSIKEKILKDRIDSGFSFSERSKAIRNLGATP